MALIFDLNHPVLGYINLEKCLPNFATVEERGSVLLQHFACFEQALVEISGFEVKVCICFYLRVGNVAGGADCH